MRRVLHLWLVLSTVPTWAHQAKPAHCEQLASVFAPQTFGYYREQAVAHVKMLEAKDLVHKVAFDDIVTQAANQQPLQSAITPERVPLALQEDLGPNLSFVPRDVPTSPDPATVSLTVQTKSFPLMSRLYWNGDRPKNENDPGRDSTTAMYFTFPGNRYAYAGNGYVVAKNKAKLVNVFAHGGGTPTATGKNGVSPGEKAALDGHISVSLDLVGHGMADKNPNDLETLKLMAYWMVDQLANVIEPGTRLHGAGHSWGAMIMLYIALHPEDPKFKDFVGFTSIAPGLDLSEGGDLDKAIAFEQYWEREGFNKCKHEMSIKDWIFQETMLEAGKYSAIGGAFCTMSSFDYILPKFDPARMAKMKPLRVIIPGGDGVTYVGRKHAAEYAFGPPLAPKDFDPKAHYQYIVIPPGRTWDSLDKDQPVPHGPFEVYAEGTKNLLVYGMLSDFEKELAEGATAEPEPQDAASELLYFVFQNWANSLAFREKVIHESQFIELGTEALQANIERVKQLDDYIGRVTDAKSESRLKQAEDAAELEAVALLVKSLDLDKERITYTSAQQELLLPILTGEQIAEYEAYQRRYRAAEEKYKSEYTDPIFEAEWNELIAPHNDGPDSLIQRRKVTPANLRDIMNELKDVRVKNEDDEATRKANARAASDRRLLASIDQKLVKYNTERNKRMNKGLDQAVRQVTPPEGVIDAGHATRILWANSSGDRRERVTKYIEQYPDVVAQARAEARAKALQNLANFQRPEGVTSFEHAVKLRRQLEDEVRLMSYSSEDPALAGIVSDMNLVAIALETAENGVAENKDKNEPGQPSLNELTDAASVVRKQYNKLIKNWDAIWSRRLAVHPALAIATAEYDNALAEYKLAYQDLGYLAVFLKQLREQGQLKGPMVKAKDDELRRREAAMAAAQAKYMKVREQLNQLRIEVASNQSLIPLHNSEQSEKDVEELHKIARRLFVADRDVSTKKEGPGMTEQLRRKDEALEARRRKISQLKQLRATYRAQYVRAVEALGKSAPHEITEIKLFDLLNRPREELLEMMRTQPAALLALEQLKKDWTPMLKEFRLLTETMDADGY